MIKKILAILGSIVVLFIIVVAMRPSHFTITRSMTMAAPAANIFPHINDFHKWQAWSPWAKMDPNAKNAFEGPAEGKGSKFSWVGNSDVGEGSMTIVDSRPSELIGIQLDFKKPMEGTSLAQFTFKPEGDKTAVTWTMNGENNFIGRAVCMFMNMDKMVGGQFEQGLATIKTLVETPAK